MASRVINALDRADLPMQGAPWEATPLPEVPLGFVERAPHVEAEPAARPEFLFADGVDPWPEIRRRLTARQFQIFEYVYRLQMGVDDVMRVVGMTRQGVHRALEAAKRRLRSRDAG